MKSKQKLSALSSLGILLATVASSSIAGPNFGANFELDNTARNGSAVADTSRGINQAGRIALDVTANAGESVTVSAKATMLTKKDGSLSTDDMWVQIGNASGGIKLGRFEATSLFPLAGDTLVNHAGNVYATNSLRGRVGSDSFHGTTTFNLSESAALEVGYVDGTKSGIATTNAKGLRAVLSLGTGPLTGRVGFESGEYAPTANGDINKIKGWGFTTSYDAGSFKVTGNYSLGQQNAAADNRQTAIGLTVAVGELSVGVVNALNDKIGGEISVQTGYVSYKMPLFNVKGATWTPALSSSTAKDSITGVSSNETAMRVRVRYDF